MNCIDQNDQNVELRRKPFKTAKLQKWSKSNDLHRFDVKNFKTTQTTKVINLHEFLRFDVQTIKTTQNNESDQITMNLHRFDVKNFKTTQNCKSNQITMNYIDITSKWSKML